MYAEDASYRIRGLVTWVWKVELKKILESKGPKR